jgi:hypothetical protein
MKIKSILTLIFIGIFSTSMAFAQSAIYTGVPLVGDQATDPFGFGDFYGDHVASNSKWLMVSAARESIDFDNDGFDSAQGDNEVGAVYIYERTEMGPVLHSKIEGEGNNINPGSPGDRFGAGIALQGNTMFVGAANDDDFPGTDSSGQDFFFAGKVYVFNYDEDTDEWLLTQKLTSDSPNGFGSFGARTNSSHIELFNFGNGQDDPTIALIGEAENGSGLIPRLHVYKRKNNKLEWNRVQVVDAPDGLAGTGFGDKVEGVGKFALVTASGVDPAVDPNVVYVYRINPNGIIKTKGKLLPIQTINAPNGVSDCGGSFGLALSAANGIVAISDPCDNTAGSNAGAVHIYTVNDNGNNNPISLLQTMPNPDSVAESFFSSTFGNGKQALSTDGDLLAVGTANASFDPSAPPQMDTKMFARDANGMFVTVDSISSPEPGFPTFELFGQSVTLLGDNQLAIGQMTNPDMVSLKGRVFLFDITP